MRKLSKRIGMAVGATTLATAGAVGGTLATTGGGGAGASTPLAVFQMVRSTAAVNTGCLPNAKANVVIKSLGPVEVMVVSANHLRPHTGFDFFVIQQPDTPFGLSWYQGDMQTDGSGNATGTFVGRFNIETFIVAPGVGTQAPVIFPTDVSTNPTTPPVHTFHLGLWFNSPADAHAAGCQASPTATTPFNGEHNAGTQVLSTRNFAPNNGPLDKIQP